jgi:hypothetical protein
MPVSQGGDHSVDIELYWTHMSRFNSIVWNSAHVDEIPGQRLAAAHFLSLTVAALRIANHRHD